MFKRTFKKLVHSVLQAAIATDTKMVLIVRTDLKMERGKVASQCAHAAVISYQQALESTDAQSQLAKVWFRRGQPKIVLKVDSESSMQKLYEHSLDNHLNTALVRDAGRTQVEHGTLTVLGIGPNDKIAVDKVTSHLKLY